MPSRLPPSRRDPEFAEKRVARAVQGLTPGAGRTANAAPAHRAPVSRIVPPAGGGGDSTHPGTGTDSTQVGATSTASAAQTVAVGVHATASADHATATGVYADAAAFGSTAVGRGAAVFSAAYEYATAVGAEASAGRIHATALGAGTNTREACVSVGFQAVTVSDFSVAVGANSEVFTSSAHSTAVGDSATVTGARGVALGADCAVTGADTGKVKVDSWEVEASSAAGAQTSVILTDSTGGRWMIGVDTSGNPIGLGPA